ncbi:hypothetical protein V3C10_18120 [[Clostridium] symbiosum]|uniref:hypothetical protein n=1 Tax=Clostridium symbiosum TaxID=1512 RepID=UPI001D0973FC|nr:hypothetical protein [[Clostridium] symbiosum]MCB6611408.1 hypothetical protein [[Clostridium] symbiosum]MCB6931173.1 hypothetical protein [[Clostridium] symbiosum]
MMEGMISAPNLMAICVDSTAQGDYSGSIWNLYQKRPIPYANTMDLLRKMDSFFNDLDFPQNSTVGRSFRKDRGAVRQKKEEAVALMDERELRKKKGEEATFIVHVKYRQNATWQGEVIWADKKEKKFFRSALELLKLMDSAMEESEE